MVCLMTIHAPTPRLRAQELAKMFVVTVDVSFQDWLKSCRPPQPVHVTERLQIGLFCEPPNVLLACNPLKRVTIIVLVWSSATCSDVIGFMVTWREVIGGSFGFLACENFFPIAFPSVFPPALPLPFPLPFHQFYPLQTSFSTTSKLLLDRIIHSLFACLPTPPFPFVCPVQRIR